jgi:hypothetical protein
MYGNMKESIRIISSEEGKDKALDNIHENLAY